ncbi:hypothetical protein [Sinosporangium siamense]|uniref:DUF1349 domain-containing protein n=1 Tax=Sinosporangium siamense TaxID=1367973 RepID=A0A919VB40_9ACTN|nr:hypothetical protein [Sinosporangium siamense]GII96092.1 hypothetical protein Ssi02_63230 [Sinosporangium siamense]
MIREEWARFGTSRGRVIGMAVAALIPLLLGLTLAVTAHATCGRSGGGHDTLEEVCPPPLLGPGGQAVEDKFYFVHQSLRGDGSITTRVNSMTGRIKEPPPPGTGGGPPPVPGLVPWAKAGVMVKDGIKQGAQYAAVMLTAEHGVRMQHNFTEDTAGSAGGGPRWLRLTRAGDTLTGFESPDGKQWTEVGRARLDGLPETVEIGLFAASPGALTMNGGATESRFSAATAVFDQVSPQRGTWKSDDIGVSMEPDGVTPHHPGGFTRSGDRFIVTGVGDIAPSTEGQPIERTLVGGFAGLIPMIVVAVTFATAGHRRGPIGRPGAGLAAKSVVIGTLAFLAGVIPAAVVVPMSLTMLPPKGVHPLPAELPAYLQVIVGTGLLFAAVAVLSLALGALIGRGVAAIAAAVTVVFVPYGLALAGLGEWLLTFTPAAGFAIQQSLREYAHVQGFYLPMTGYFPLSPWAGFGVLCAYAALAHWAAGGRRNPT